MSEPTSPELLILVELRCPPGMSPEEAVEEVRRSVGFGQPEVTLVYILENPDEQES